MIYSSKVLKAYVCISAGLHLSQPLHAASQEETVDVTRKQMQLWSLNRINCNSHLRYDFTALRNNVYSIECVLFCRTHDDSSGHPA